MEQVDRIPRVSRRNRIGTSVNVGARLNELAKESNHRNRTPHDSPANQAIGNTKLKARGICNLANCARLTAGLPGTRSESTYDLPVSR